VPAFAPATSAPSNGVCRSVGFRLADERDVTYAGQLLGVNHWVIDPRADLP
jgi:hypothetical protein